MRFHWYGLTGPTEEPAAVILFLDRLEFLALSSALAEHSQPWVIALPIVTAEATFERRPPGRPARFYPWLLDTAYTGQAHVWQADLSLLGLSPNVPLRLRSRATLSAYGERAVNRLRDVGLWLFSNVPGQ